MKCDSADFSVATARNSSVTSNANCSPGMALSKLFEPDGRVRELHGLSHRQDHDRSRRMAYLFHVEQSPTPRLSIECFSRCHGLLSWTFLSIPSLHFYVVVDPLRLRCTVTGCRVMNVFARLGGLQEIVKFRRVMSLVRKWDRPQPRLCARRRSRRRP